MMRHLSLIAIALALFSSVLAVQLEYNQCGGKLYTGATDCDTGLTCTYVNDFYSQCLKAAASSTPTVPSTSTKSSTSTAPTSTTSATCANVNPFIGYVSYLNPQRVAQVQAAAAKITDATLQAQAIKVANIPTFTWFTKTADVPLLGTYLADAAAKQASTGNKYLLGIVLYNLPDRDCGATTSWGEYTINNGGEALYKQFIDQIVLQIKKYPTVRVVAIIEPSALAYLVTGLNVAKCANAGPVYQRLITYAMTQLNTASAYTYLDAAYAGWLGWPANLTPAATLFTALYNAAGKPACVRGLSTNVGNYDVLNAVTTDPVAQVDENHYINALAPILVSKGFPAHFIVDISRAGQGLTRSNWNYSCNLKAAGLGALPTTNTNNPLIDALVWVKNPGESDGTSVTTSAHFDTSCGVADALVPSPDAGAWFQAHFESLVAHANPPL